METAKLSLVTSVHGEREESILPLCRVRVARKPAEPRLLFSSTSTRWKLSPLFTRTENLSRPAPRLRQRKKIGKWCRIVTVTQVDAMLIHRDHKGSLYKFHPLYEILCDGGDLAGTLECSSTKTGPRDRRFIGKRGYLGSRAYNKIYARDLFPWSTLFNLFSFSLLPLFLPLTHTYTRIHEKSLVYLTF